MDSIKFAKYLEMIFFPLTPIILSLLFIAFYVKTMLFENMVVLMSCAVIFSISHMIIKDKVKEENKKYFISSAVISITFFILSQMVGVSHEIFFSGVTLFIVAVLTYSIRPHWKISAHMIGYVSMVTVLTFLNVKFLFLYILVPLIAWSRLVLKRHNIYQIIAGTILGVLVPIFVSSLM